MGVDDAIAVAVIGAVVTLGVACLISVGYVRKVNRERTEASRYLDMLIARDTRVGIAQADLLAFVAYVQGRLWFPESVPSIGPGFSSLWLGSVLLLMGWGPVSDAIQFRRDRRLGRNDL